jgi:hypothetical protein
MKELGLNNTISDLRIRMLTTEQVGLAVTRMIPESKDLGLDLSRDRPFPVNLPT